MCGIAGILTRDEALARGALPTLVTALRHRGPDDAGQEQLRVGPWFLGLGHTRLSIIDLSPAGHQPMVNRRSGDWLSYNGEIYNFPALRAELCREGVEFVGHSDTEVLLHAMSVWGEACLPRLQGMFAFAFYDARAGRLVLARDPVGIKPLYLAALPDGGLLFASEVRAIIETGLVSRRVDQRGLAGLLAYGAVQGPCTLFRDIEELPPGYLQIVTAGAQRVRRRFWWPRAQGAAGITPRGAVDSVRATVDAAVKDHLVSDVPVGLFLSSGLDSTIVAGVASRHTSRLRSFTVGFAEDPDLSELALASRTARRFGLEHTEISITGRDAEAATEAWLGALDLPSVDGLNVFLISRFVREQGIKVALSGQGGDELFGGYPTFADVPRLQRWFRLARFVPPQLRRRLAALATGFGTVSMQDKAVDLASSDGSLLSLYLRRRRLMSDRQMSALGVDRLSAPVTREYLPAAASPQGLGAPTDAVIAVSHFETEFYLGNMLLRDGDANSMRHALEVRVPLLDRRLLDLMLSLPGSVRLPTGRADKHLLRAAFPELLPGASPQKKRGFTLPLGRWMRGPLRALSESGLGAVKSIGLIDPAGVDAVWTSFLNQPESPIWSRAFMLVVLGNYLRDLRATA